jgi:hypothetical protein
MAKCWTTKTGRGSWSRLLAIACGFVEDAPPEGTPQRLCPHSAVLSKNGGSPATKSLAILARPMQEGGTDPFEATQGATHDSK